MTGLHGERTALAWSRTGLALIGLAAIVVRLRFDRPTALATAVVAVSGLLALTVLLGGVRRYRTSHGAGGDAPKPTDGRLPAAVVLVTVLVATIELAGILAE